MASADLSVIVPTFDRPQKTERALRSLVGQGLALDVVVVDDGSPEPFTPSPDLDRALGIRVLRQAANRGPAAARNAGVAATRAEWITFLDSDDALTPGSLAGRLAFARDGFARSGDALAAYACAHRGVSAEGTPLYRRRPRPAAELAAFASGCWFCPGSALIMRREAALRIGPQDESLKRLEDLDWFIRLALLGGSVVVDDVVGVDVEVGHKPRVAAVDDSSARLLGKWGGTAPGTRLPGPSLRRLRAYLLLERAAARWYAGRRLTALGLIAASAALAPRLTLHLSPHWEDAEP